MTSKFNFTIKKNETVTLVFTYTDDNDTPINITGYTARMQIKADYGETAITTLTESSGIDISGADGQLTVTISSAATSAYTFTTAVYDLLIKSPGGVVTYLVEGKIDLELSATSLT